MVNAGTLDYGGILQYNVKYVPMKSSILDNCSHLLYLIS